MLATPAYLSQAFEVQTNQRNVPDQQRRNFHNWLQYYLDFCSPVEGTHAFFAHADQTWRCKTRLSILH